MCMFEKYIIQILSLKQGYVIRVVPKEIIMFGSHETGEGKAYETDRF